MPDRNLPRWGRVTLRTVGAVAYMLVCLAGVVAFTWPPESAPEGAHIVIKALGGLCAVSAFICALAVIRFRWRIELVLTWWVGATLLGYVAVAFSQRPYTPLLSMFMCLTLALALTIFSRGVSLLVFEHQSRVLKEG